MKVYYAHPMVAYGTRREQEELDIIRRKAPGAEVINPARYSGDPSKTHEHMEFYHGLVDECDVVVYSDVGGEFISAGVGEEVGYALEKGKPVYRIDHKTRRLVRVHGEAKHLSRAGTRLLYRTMKWSGLRGEDLNKMVRMKIAEFSGRLSEEDALLMVAADLGVNTKAYFNNALKEAPKQIKAEKSEKPNHRDAETLKRLYEKEKLSIYKMGKLLGKSHTTVHYWLRKHGIERRTLSEAGEIYPKMPFSGNPAEKASMLGLRYAEMYVRKPHEDSNILEISTSTTKDSMRKLVRGLYGKYGHYHECPIFDKKTKRYGFRISVLVDFESSKFLTEERREVPEGNLFWPFLAYYGAGEENWNICESKGCIQIRFRLQTADHDLLKQINKRLEDHSFHPNFRLVEPAGKHGRTKDLYGVFLDRRDEVTRLAEGLLPYSKHDEKIAWMKLILEVKNEKHWADVKDRVRTLQKKIERETEKCVKEAEEEYKRRHGGKDWFKVHSHRK